MTLVGPGVGARSARGRARTPVTGRAGARSMTHRLHRLAKGLRQEVVTGGGVGCPSGSRSRRGGPAGRTRSRRLPSLARTRPPVGGVRCTSAACRTGCPRRGRVRSASGGQPGPVQAPPPAESRAPRWRPSVSVLAYNDPAGLARDLAAARCLGDAAVHGQVPQLQPEQLVAGAKHRTAQVLGHAGADSLVAAAAQGGGRAGLVGDATVAAAEHQDLDELVKHQPVAMRGRWQPSGWRTWRTGSRANWTHNGSRIDDGRAGTRPPDADQG
jgi:hypothetical protein